MCRILAIKKFDFRIHRQFLENFIDLAGTGNTLNKSNPGHLDGWGIGYYRDSTACIYKSCNSALQDKEKIFKTLQRIGRSSVLLVHLRKSAWKNTSTRRHAHPFKFKNLLFAHNGTISDYNRLIGGIRPDYLPAADSLDTEVFFRYITQRSYNGIESGFQDSIAHIRNKNKYTSLTSVLTDGKTLIAYREYKKHHDYYTLYKTSYKDSDIICSEQIEANFCWGIVAKNKLFIL
jgi:predicted glutamine amidotransferase